MLTTIIFFLALIITLYLVLGIVINLSDGNKLDKLSILLTVVAISFLWSLLFYLLN